MSAPRTCRRGVLGADFWAAPSRVMSMDGEVVSLHKSACRVKNSVYLLWWLRRWRGW